MNRKLIQFKKWLNNDAFPHRKIYLIFSIISGLILTWVLLFNFTTILHDTSSYPRKMVKGSYGANIHDYFGKASWFTYFTNLSNVFFFIVTTVRIFYRKNIWTDHLQIAAASYMIVVGVVYWSAIAPLTWHNAIKNGHTSMFAPNYFFINFILNNLLIHFVTVVLSVVIVFIGIKRQQYTFFPNIYKIIIFPVIYYLVTWSLYLYTAYAGSHGTAYIYEFLGFFSPYGAQNTFIIILVDILVFVVILLLFLSSYWLIIKIISKNTPYKTINSNEKTLNITPRKKPSNSHSKKITSKTPTKNSSKVIVKSKPTKRKTTYYIIQKSVKSKGWELIKTGGVKATFVAKTKLEVQNYYYKKLKNKDHNALIKKNKHGKVQS